MRNDKLEFGKELFNSLNHAARHKLMPIQDIPRGIVPDVTQYIHSRTTLFCKELLPHLNVIHRRIGSGYFENRNIGIPWIAEQCFDQYALESFGSSSVRGILHEIGCLDLCSDFISRVPLGDMSRS